MKSCLWSLAQAMVQSANSIQIYPIIHRSFVWDLITVKLISFAGGLGWAGIIHAEVENNTWKVLDSIELLKYLTWIMTIVTWLEKMLKQEVMLQFFMLYHFVAMWDLLVFREKDGIFLSSKAIKLKFSWLIAKWCKSSVLKMYWASQLHCCKLLGSWTVVHHLKSFNCVQLRRNAA